MTSHRFQVVLNHLNTPVHPSIKRTSTLKYVATVDNALLTTAQRDFYEENGYIIIKNMVEPDLAKSIGTLMYSSRLIDLCTGVADPGRMTLVREKSLNNIAKEDLLYNRATDLLCDNTFVKYCTHPKLLDYVSCFIGPDITAIHSMFVCKAPDSGKLMSTHPMHQDLHFFPVRPVERVVTAWTALEKTTKENGCIHVVPGSHRCVLQPHAYPEYEVNFGFHGIPDTENLPRVFLEMEKGDTLFLHPLVVHGSGPNLSKGCRTAIKCWYASNHCHFVNYTNTPNELSSKLAEDMAKLAGMNATHSELMKLTNVVVRGTPGRLQTD